MRLQMWHVVIVLVPVLIALVVVGLYWVVRLAVRAGIRDVQGGRGTPHAGPPAGPPGGPL